MSVEPATYDPVPLENRAWRRLPITIPYDIVEPFRLMSDADANLMRPEYFHECNGFNYRGAKLRQAASKNDEHLWSQRIGELVLRAEGKNHYVMLEIDRYLQSDYYEAWLSGLTAATLVRFVERISANRIMDCHFLVMAIQYLNMLDWGVQYHLGSVYRPHVCRRTGYGPAQLKDVKKVGVYVDGIYDPATETVKPVHTGRWNEGVLVNLDTCCTVPLEMLTDGFSESGMGIDDCTPVICPINLDDPQQVPNYCLVFTHQYDRAATLARSMGLVR